jgi:hypothetical protein
MPPREFWTGRGPPQPRRAGALVSDAEPRPPRFQAGPPPRIALRCGAAATRIPTGQGVPESRQSPKPLLDLEDLRPMTAAAGTLPALTVLRNPALVRSIDSPPNLARGHLEPVRTDHPWGSTWSVGRAVLPAEVENSWLVPRGTQTFRPWAHRRFCWRVPRPRLAAVAMGLHWGHFGCHHPSCVCAQTFPGTFNPSCRHRPVTRDSMPEIDHAGVSMAHRARPSRS